MLSSGRRKAAEGRGVASRRPPMMEEGTMNRAPTSVRPAANKMPLGRDAVPTLPARRSREVTWGHGEMANLKGGRKPDRMLR